MGEGQGLVAGAQGDDWSGLHTSRIMLMQPTGRGCGRCIGVGALLRNRGHGGFGARKEVGGGGLFRQGGERKGEKGTQGSDQVAAASPADRLYIFRWLDGGRRV